VAAAAVVAGEGPVARCHSGPARAQSRVGPPHVGGGLGLGMALGGTWVIGEAGGEASAGATLAVALTSHHACPRGRYVGYASVTVITCSPKPRARGVAPARVQSEYMYLYSSEGAK
jgi:hypothetical protein